MGLKWDAVDLDKGIVTVREARVVAGREVITTSTKNKTERPVPVGPEVIADLMALKMAQDIEAKDFGPNYNPEGLVVVNEVGEPIRPETYSGWFEKHTEAAGLPKIRLHDLRHTAASLLASQGVPIIIASELLGHDPQIFTKVYADLYPEDLKQAASTLTNLYTGAA